jgi:hypothetical protein
VFPEHFDALGEQINNPAVSPFYALGKQGAGILTDPPNLVAPAKQIGILSTEFRAVSFLVAAGDFAAGEANVINLGGIEWGFTVEYP